MVHVRVVVRVAVKAAAAHLAVAVPVHLHVVRPVSCLPVATVTMIAVVTAAIATVLAAPMIAIVMLRTFAIVRSLVSVMMTMSAREIPSVRRSVMVSVTLSATSVTSSRMVPTALTTRVSCPCHYDQTTSHLRCHHQNTTNLPHSTMTWTPLSSTLWPLATQGTPVSEYTERPGWSKNLACVSIC
jgi:hypothetical protein